MSVPAPHFLLYSQAALVSAGNGPAHAGQTAAGTATNGRWKFVLRRRGGDDELEAEDDEPEASPERLELLAIVRGLEALDQRARVTLVAPSRYVQRGLEFGLAQWRENSWQWERFGRMTPVKDRDLWQRLERLLDIHTIECRPTRAKPADDLAAPPVKQPHSTIGGRRIRIDSANNSLPGRAPGSAPPGRLPTNNASLLSRFCSSFVSFGGKIAGRLAHSRPKASGAAAGAAREG